MSVVCFALSGLYDGPIPHPGESYRECVSLNVVRCNNDPVQLLWVGRRGQPETTRKRYHLYDDEDNDSLLLVESLII